MIQLSYPSGIQTSGYPFLIITSHKFEIPLLEVNKENVKTKTKATENSGSASNQAKALVKDAQEKIDLASNKKSEVIDTIALIAPGGLDNNLSPQWQNANIIPLGKDMLNKQNSISQVILSNVAKNTGQMISDKLQKTVLGGIDTLSTAEAALGYVAPINATKVFKGPSFRSFGLDVLMIPKNKPEARTIAKIVEIFENACIPVVSGFENSSIKLGYKYPLIFDIILSTGGKIATNQNSFFDRRSMAITNFKASYSSAFQHMTLFNDNQPSDTKISITFESIAPIVR